MPTTSSRAVAEPLAVLHLAEDPNDAHLLREELRVEGFAPEVHRVASAESLRAAVAGDGYQVLVVDLPLPLGIEPQLLDELSAAHPELGVVFRWGQSGERAAETPAEQLGRRIRSLVAQDPVRPQDEATRRRTLAELVRLQQAHLELARTDLWDFGEAVQRLTATMAELVGTERVGLWLFSADRRSLRCVDVYTRSLGVHARSGDLAASGEYLCSLQASLTLATGDAERDPRTRDFARDYLQPLGITAMLDAPVRRDGRVVGVLCHEHVGPTPRTWSLLDQCAAAKGANFAARALEVRDRRRLGERLAQLERLDAIGDLARGIAHDMNNLLTVLGASLDECAVTAGEARAQALQAAQGASGRLRDLVASLAAAGRSEHLRRERLELAAWLAGEVATLRRGAALDAHLHVATETGPLWVEADATALARILLNLVKNAAESRVPSGGQDVTVRLARRDGSDAPGLEAGPYATIAVVDQGAGIAPEHLGRVFEPRFSTKHGVLRGMGLATSFGLAHQHEGTITVDSEPGRGSTFTLWLPLAEDVAGA